MRTSACPYWIRGEKLLSVYVTSCREFAFPHDDLTPLSESFTDGRNGFGASAVDALSTLVCEDADSCAFLRAKRVIVHYWRGSEHTFLLF